MIDYYQGIETETGEEIAYLQDVAKLLSVQDTTTEIYHKLTRLSEELADRENLGQFDVNSAKLSQELNLLKKIFFDDTTRNKYDKALIDTLNQTKYQDVMEEPLTTSRSQASIREQSRNRKLNQKFNLSWQKLLVQALILIIIISMSIFMNIKMSLLVIILLVLLVFGLLFSN
ncbi:hypothetical protein A9Q68_06815 [Streptococcus bovimastitidis]|uniref:Uncharacterized protein n=1 Tax=Streptococcus bovimastitidis TaxID=1856638 RepID=A0A1L8MLR5_9STRE|nr:hypothetical protein [Streptococcus bovimastitidis]OJF71693.1 hypothetical protein A9Q68_06815 [Streptococcus bovimastitidis]